MAREKETQTPQDAPAKTGFGLQMPLPLSERRRLLQAEQTQKTQGQIYTDWALI